MRNPNSESSVQNVRSPSALLKEGRDLDTKHSKMILNKQHRTNGAWYVLSAQTDADSTYRHMAAYCNAFINRKLYLLKKIKQIKPGVPILLSRWKRKLLNNTSLRICFGIYPFIVTLNAVNVSESNRRS